MRVTLIGSLPPQKGISPYVKDLATALAARGDVELEVLSFRSLYPGWLYPGGDPSDGAGPPEVPGARVRQLLTWWNSLGWVIAGLRLRGEVVHAQWWSFFLAPAYLTLLAVARLRGKAVVVTVHNVEPHDGGLLRRVANRWVLPLAHRLIVHTERNRAALVSHGVAAEKVTVVAHGVPGPFATGNEERLEARASLGLPLRDPVALFLGHVRPYKGVAELIQAFRLVVDELPRARLVVAGQAWEDSQPLAALVAQLSLEDSVHLRFGYVPSAEVPAYFAGADVVVCPYLHFEAQSGTACRALAHGKALIVTDVGGLPDLVDHREAIVPPGDAAALARVLIRALRDPGLRREMEAASRRKAAESSWQRVAEATAAVYRGCTAGRRLVPATTPARR